MLAAIIETIDNDAVSTDTHISRTYSSIRTNKMTIDDNSDDWCLGYLRFTRVEIKEIAFVRFSAIASDTSIRPMGVAEQLC